MANATLGVARSANTHIEMAGNFTFIAGLVLGVTFGPCGVTLRILAIEIAFLQRVGFVPILRPPKTVPQAITSAIWRITMSPRAHATNRRGA